MRLPRFFLESLEHDHLRLIGSEARHAAGARRVRVGQRVALFDGAGREVTGTVTAVQRDVVEILVQQRREAAPPAGPRLTLAVAMPKGPRADWLIEKAAELGVAAVWPIVSRRSVMRAGGGRLEKWRRIARQANKQSGRNDLMAVGDPCDVAAAALRCGQFDTVWLADPQGDPDPGTAAGQARGIAENRRDLVFVGAEGGFTQDERETILAAGAMRLCLAKHVLRVETAAVAVAALWAVRNERS